MKESDIQSQIISYLQILEKQGKLFFNRMNNIPTPIKDGKTIGLEVGYREKKKRKWGNDLKGVGLTII